MPETKFKYQKGYSKTVINIGKLKNRYIHTPSLGKEVFYSKRLLGRGAIAIGGVRLLLALGKIL